MNRLPAVMLVWSIALPAGAADPPVRPYLEAHCTGCHGKDKPKGGLDLESLPATFTDQAVIVRWVAVHDRVRAGEMPPSARPKPPAAETAAVLKSLTDQIFAAEAKRVATAGRSVVRRLNRTEYENTLRDLLDLPALNVKELIPDDGRSDGFDKSAAALDVSPTLLARYAEAADVALDAAIAKWAVPSPAVTRRLYAHQQYDFGIVIPNGDGVMLKDMKYDDSRYPIPKTDYAGGKYKDIGDLERSGVWLERPGTAGLFRCLGESFFGRFNRFSPTASGRYRITLSVWSFWWDKGKVEPSPRTQTAAVRYDGKFVGLFDAPSLKPTTYTIETWLDAGHYLTFDPVSLWEVHVYHRQGKAAAFTGPGVAIDFLEVDGPLTDEWPPASHRRLFGDLPLVPFAKLPPGAPRPARQYPVQQRPDAHNGPSPVLFATVSPSDPAASAERLLTAFLPRAFRRPVSSAEVVKYTVIALNRIAAGAAFEDAMKAAYKAALCGPDFLFLHQPVGKLDDHALAARLSYFLWGSMPDDALTAHAAAGRLRDPAVLRAETDRLLASPKSDRFVADFLDQWLELHMLDATTPDNKLYPEYRPDLADAVRKEPRLFFREVLTHNLPASAVVHTDFAMLNGRLAEHYGIPGVTGVGFRRVPLPANSHRGGFLGQAAIHKATANGTTTSPVKRGVWVQRAIVGDPPKPPPPDVPAIEPDVRGTTTVREQLAKHRESPACASCHKAIDPPGFALECYDPIGRFRDRYRTTVGKDVPDLDKQLSPYRGPDGHLPKGLFDVHFRSGPAVDATGQTTSGRTFAGIDEFKTILLADQRAIARNLTRQLVVYATGAPIGFADRPAVESILDRAGGAFPVRSLIHEVVQSPLFVSK